MASQRSSLGRFCGGFWCWSSEGLCGGFSESSLEVSFWFLSWVLGTSSGTFKVDAQEFLEVIAYYSLTLQCSLFFRTPRPALTHLLGFFLSASLCASCSSYFLRSCLVSFLYPFSWSSTRCVTSSSLLLCQLSVLCVRFLIVCCFGPAGTTSFRSVLSSLTERTSCTLAVKR